MTEADTKRLAEIRERTEDWCREDNDSQEGCHTLIDTDIPWLLDLVARLQELIDRAECPECGMDARERDIQNTLASAGSERVMDNWNRIAAEQRIAKLEASLTDISTRCGPGHWVEAIARDALAKP